MFMRELANLKNELKGLDKDKVAMLKTKAQRRIQVIEKLINYVFSDNDEEKDMNTQVKTIMMKVPVNNM